MNLSQGQQTVKYFLRGLTLKKQMQAASWPRRTWVSANIAERLWPSHGIAVGEMEERIVETVEAVLVMILLTQFVDSHLPLRDDPPPPSQPGLLGLFSRLRPSPSKNATPFQ